MGLNGNLTGGRTPFGAELNRNSRLYKGIKTAKNSVKFGIIKEVLEDQYLVTVQLFNKDGSLSTSMVSVFLEEVTMDLAATRGKPKAIIGSYCKIEYTGGIIDNGRATVIEDPNEDPDNVIASNEMRVKGAAYAPPGGMKI